jgi:rfaE bifunctional protein kinase chain/domain/rfaE bifunctional protein nucleotidyltransferase chain/domain
MNLPRKICTLDQLLAFREQARDAGQTVVHCHGCFDIVHPGHVHHLEYARSLGDLLVVTVSSDTHVAKGVNRPLIPDDLRARNLAALQAVDVVYVNPHATAVELLEQLKPDVYVKGREYENSADPRFVAEKRAVTDRGGRVVFSGGEVVYSSTALINSLAATDAFEDEKLRRFADRYELNPGTLANLVHRFRDLKIVVAGDYMLDRYHFCEALGIAGEAPVMSLRSLQRKEYDGGAGVVALHLAAMGCSPTLVTTMAGDDVADAARLRLSAAGIDVQDVENRRNTVVKERYLVEETKMFRVEEGGPAPLDSQVEARYADLLLEASKGADAVIFTDFGYGTLTHGVLERVTATLRKTVPILTADVSGSQGNLLKFRGMDLVCPTEREARQNVGDFGSGLGAAVAKLLGKLDSRQAIITLGKQGLVTFDWPDEAARAASERLRSEYIPALSKRGIDPLGCGDALLSAATAALAAGGSLMAGALLGAYAAALEVQQVGNVPVTADELLRLTADTMSARPPTRIAI